MKLEIKDLFKKYKNESSNVLDGINLSFKGGELVSILGESGSGKTTLMNIIGGLDLSYSGELIFKNNKINRKNVDVYRKNNVGFIFQSFNLLPHLTAYENVLLSQKLNSNKNKIQIKELFKKMNIENIMDKKPNELSGGQKQRVAIIRSLINDPDIILADEPTGALDQKNSEIVIDILKEVASLGKIVIVVTHSKKVAQKASRIIKISDGKIIENKNNYDIKYKENNIERKKVKKIPILTLLKLPLINIKKNLKRNLLIVLASSIGIFSISFMFFLSSGIKKYVNKEVNLNVKPNVIEVNKSKDVLKENSFTESDLYKIQSIRHIGKIKKNISISNSSSVVINDEKYDLISLSTFSNIKKKDLKYGRRCNDDEIMISEYLAKKIDKNLKNVVGKNVKLYVIDNNEPKVIEREYQISGIIKKSNNDFVDNMYFGYINYSSLDKFYSDNNLKLKPNNLSVYVDDVKNVKNVKNKLISNGFSHSNTSKMFDSILNYLNIITFILVGISSISLIVSSIMILIIMYINVIERTKEIGILRALGAKVNEIKNIFLIESSMLGLFSGIHGVIISVLLSIIINSYTNSAFNNKFISIDFKYVIFSILISTMISSLAGIKPAKKASRLDPVDSLRYE